MFQLLNRITWALSLLLWLSITMIANDSFFTWLIWLILWVAIKYIIFPPHYIKTRLVFFKNKILNTSPEDLENIDITLQEETIQWVDNSILTPVKSEALRTIKSEVFIREEQIQKEIVLQNIPHEPNIFQKFFAENILAKIWGIIVFIWVLFFLSAIYIDTGPVGKIVIWFLLGFGFYGIGVMLDKKWFTAEARIIMGLAILINYLVILSGRFLLWDESSIESSFLSVASTFMFLILNTVLAVTTSLVYKSQSLLIFSFVFAYINPLLVGGGSPDPYTLLGYTMIVTFWAMFLSYTKKDIYLFTLSFILASILLLIAPYSDPSGWVSKLLCINVLGALALYSSTIFKKKMLLLSEVLIAGIFFLIGVMWLLSVNTLSEIQMTILWVSSLGLMLFCYISAKKWFYLYSIWTLGTILTLSPAIYANGLEPQMLAISCSIVVIFAAMNIWYVLDIWKKILTENIWNIMWGLVSWTFFLTYMIYFFWGEYFPGIAQWFAFVLLAWIYASLGFLFVKSVGIKELQENPASENIFYSISALALSIFSLAVAFVFSEQKEIISIVWLLESSVLFFLAHKLSSLKTLIAALVLYIIWILRIVPFVDSNLTHDYGLLIASLIIVGVIFFNLFLLLKIDIKKNVYLETMKYFHHIIHVIGIIIISTVIYNIISPENEWVSLLYVSVIPVVIGIIYRKIQEYSLIIVSNIVLVILYLLHLGILIDVALGNLNIWISLWILLFPLIIFIIEYFKYTVIKSIHLFAITIVYLFMATTLYVNYFSGIFAITMYWGALAFAVMAYGIARSFLPMRTIGLYLITLTIVKIFLLDIWQSELSGGLWYLIFMVTWVLMIILSIMYTKKFGNTLNKDFSPSNLFPEKTWKWDKDTEEDSQSFEKTDVIYSQENTVMQDISKVNIAGIKWVRMSINGKEKAIQIRTENLTKITKMIVASKWKQEFKAWELKDVYKLISKDYKSQLPPAQYNKIQEIVEQFVEHGGKIEFIKE